MCESDEFDSFAFKSTLNVVKILLQDPARFYLILQNPREPCRNLEQNHDHVERTFKCERVTYGMTRSLPKKLVIADLRFEQLKFD